MYLLLTSDTRKNGNTWIPVNPLVLNVTNMHFKIIPLVKNHANISNQWLNDGQLSSEEAQAKAQQLLLQHFRPEFLNRIDDTIIFNRLGLEQVKAIIELELDLLQRRLADRKLGLQLTAEAKAKLASQSYDPVYGARPLRRTIQRQILDPLAVELLSGHFVDDSQIKVDLEHGEFVFQHQSSSQNNRS